MATFKYSTKQYPTVKEIKKVKEIKEINKIKGDKTPLQMMVDDQAMELLQKRVDFVFRNRNESTIKRK